MKGFSDPGQRTQEDREPRENVLAVSCSLINTE